MDEMQHYNHITTAPHPNFKTSHFRLISIPSALSASGRNWTLGQLLAADPSRHIHIKEESCLCRFLHLKNEEIGFIHLSRTSIVASLLISVKTK